MGIGSVIRRSVRWIFSVPDLTRRQSFDVIDFAKRSLFAIGICGRTVFVESTWNFLITNFKFYFALARWFHKIPPAPRTQY